jgi:ATP-dependent DNA helicase DinG
VRSFDPDEDDPYREPDAEDGAQLDDDVVQIDVDAALELLDRVTHDLPGGGEHREGQREMVRLVVAAWSRGRSAALEAGTGVGKSLAYLVPAALAGRRVVVATATKNLQDQLATRDVPAVAAHVPGLRVAVLKGRSNYLCRNRAGGVGGGQLSFDDGESVPRGVANQMRRVLAWSNETTTGDRDELTFEVDERAWRGLSVTPQECLGRAQCPQGASCFAELAKDRASEANLLVVNTHLYAAHLASGSMLLPAHDHVVFDEAHEAINIFASLLGTTLTASRLRSFAGAARPQVPGDLRDRCDELVRAADHLSLALETQFDSDQLTGLSEDVAAALARAGELVITLVEALRALNPAGADAEARRIRALGPGVHLSNDLVRLSSVRDGELLFVSRRDREVTIELSLVDVAPRLREVLWERVTALATSATLPDTLPRDLGLDDVAVQRVASPFDYQNNALLYVPANFPERRDERAEAAIVDELVTLIGAAEGRTLALFTNRQVMIRVAERVESRIETPVLVQGTLSRGRIIEQFRDEPAASLFAVTSFWQGVDVPGHSLSLVTIDRLPFTVPNDPLAEARRARSVRPFYDVDLPRAAMLLAQGVGRLIRNRDDRGVVAVLDTRLAESSYRGALFRLLPPMRRTRDRDQVVEFLRDLAAHQPGTD